jgi:O-succinylbenzoic acid--CoA ligase
VFLINFPDHNDGDLQHLARTKLATTLPEWEFHIWSFIDTWLNKSIQQIAISTSGSTGLPKTIEHTKQAMQNSALMTCAALGIKKHQHALLCLPANKIGGMMMIVRSYIQQLPLYCIKPSIHPLLETDDNVTIDFAAFTPMQFNDITLSEKALQRAGKIGTVILGGEPSGQSLLQHIAELKSSVYATFGMTETISHIALMKLSGNNRDKYYKVLPGVNIMADDNGQLVIEAPALGQPLLKTNDIIKLHGVNQFEWVGRADNVINSGGVKIYPEEIELHLQSAIQHPFFVGPVSDKLSGERPAIIIETDTITAKELDEIKYSTEQLEKIKRPKQVLLCRLFIRTTNGKVKRRDTLLLPMQVIQL